MFSQALDFADRVWDGVNVGHKGSFSARRLLHLHRFILQESQPTCPHWMRVMAIALWTPVPCLIATLLSETLPLASPLAGPKANVFFWVRSWLVQACYTYAFFMQVLHCIPALPQRLVMLIPISAAISAGHTAVHFVVASTLGFPVPFSNLVLDTPWIVLIVAALWIYIGPACRSSALVHVHLKKIAFVIYASSSLAIVYPLFYYAFLAAKKYPHTQIILTLLVLPLIKLLEKLLLHRVTCHIPDIQPVYIAFNVEVFNALFISSCMRNATSITVTVSLMAVDFLSSSAALYGLRNLMTQIDEMNAKMGSLVTREDMLDIAALVLSDLHTDNFAAHESRSELEQRVPEAKTDWAIRQITHQFTATITPLPAVTLGMGRAHQGTAGKNTSKAVTVATLPVLPSNPVLKTMKSSNNKVASTGATLLLRGPNVSTKHHRTASTEMIHRLSSKERQYYVLEASRILHRVEALLVIEYTEVIVPILYAIYIAVVYRLPNRAYFSYLRDLSETELAIAVQSVLVYGMLQMLSFLLLLLALRLRFQLLPSAQLHFALSSEGKLVKALLTLWVMYVLQTSLDHVGTDYTFRFEWLHNKS